MTEAEIISIGNELLLGDVLDTNTNWLFQQITGIGGKVTRAVMVGDELTVIAREISESIESRRAQAIFTTGGLGPTADDLTLRAVAEATGRPIETDARALDMVRAAYEELARRGHVESGELTVSRIKMARLPRGSLPLENPVGAAPGVLLSHCDSRIICLPGVPSELRGIVTSSLQPILKLIFGQGAYVRRRLVVDVNDESALAPILYDVANRHEGVYLKSRPQRFGPQVRIRVTLSASGTEADRVAQQLDQAIHDLEETLKLAGLEVVDKGE
jgi:molybdenum cofactor synthesis domain-containing protein